jgi:hypothetical protein
MICGFKMGQALACKQSTITNEVEHCVLLKRKKANPDEDY